MVTDSAKYQISSTMDLITNYEYIYITLNTGGYIQVKLSNDGVVVDIFENNKDANESIASTYATYEEMANG